MTTPEAIDATESRGLPDATTARANALAGLRETLDAAADHARNEALSDLSLCLSAASGKVKSIQAFDRALIDVLPECDRGDAVQFVRQRDAASLWTPSPEDIPF